MVPTMQRSRRAMQCGGARNKETHCNTDASTHRDPRSASSRHQRFRWSVDDEPSSRRRRVLLRDDNRRCTRFQRQVVKTCTVHPGTGDSDLLVPGLSIVRDQSARRDCATGCTSRSMEMGSDSISRQLRLWNILFPVAQCPVRSKV